MKHLLQRHPVPMRTRFAHSLVLTYALPPDVLQPLLPPGLALDTYTDPGGTEHGFVAAALVDTRDLRPAFLPAYSAPTGSSPGTASSPASRPPPGGPCAA
ncbi:hypothetical protein ACFQ1I_37800 [Kitasatospora arboriphila]